MRSWREHAEALEEYRGAAQRYELSRSGLGVAVMDAVDAAVESILDPSVNARWGALGGF